MIAPILRWNDEYTSKDQTMNALILLPPFVLLIATIALQAYIVAWERRWKQFEKIALAKLDDDMASLVATYGDSIKTTESYQYYLTMKR
jgi:hypothetical protein